MHLGMSDLWLDLGESVYFLPRNHTRRWRIEFYMNRMNRMNSWRVTMEGEEHFFPTKRTAKRFVEATYELTKP